MPARPPRVPKQPSSGNKMPIIIGAVAAVVVIAGALVFVLKGNGGEDTPTEAVTTEQVPSSGAASNAPSPAQPAASSAETPEAALAMMADASTAPQGLEKLKQIAEGTDKASAANALYELSQLYAQPDYYSNKAVLDNVKALLPKDYKTAHELNEKCLAIAPDNYKAIYEFATDYYAGEARGAVDRDVNKARELYTKGKALAEQAGDEYYIERYGMRLNALENE